MILFLKGRKNQIFPFKAVDEDSDQHCTVYVKVHVPFEVLCLYAEELNMRAPLQVSSTTQHTIT